LRQTGLLAIAMLRRNEAIEWLLDLVTAAPPKDAKSALEALELYQQDSTLWLQVQNRLENRPDIR